MNKKAGWNNVLLILPLKYLALAKTKAQDFGMSKRRLYFFLDVSFTQITVSATVACCQKWWHS